MIPLAKDGDNFLVDFSATESPLEEMFAWQMKRTRLGLAGVYTQAQILSYRVDFLIKHQGRSIVVELDGRRYHDRDRDAERDSRIIDHVDEIIRIPYSAMINENATMTVLGMWCDRFNVPRESTTISFADAIAEYRQSSDEKFSNWSWMQVYTEHSSAALVGSLEQIAMGRNILPITRRIRK
jgi:very-short-patch-repair endonuclease